MARSGSGKSVGGNHQYEDSIALHREDVICHEGLGGLLKHYERKAA
jgi:hypothetical protein